MKSPVFSQMINVWPFIEGAYAVTVLFLLGLAWLTYWRYRRAQLRLVQAEQL